MCWQGCDHFGDQVPLSAPAEFRHPLAAQAELATVLRLGWDAQGELGPLEGRNLGLPAQHADVERDVDFHFQIVTMALEAGVWVDRHHQVEISLGSAKWARTPLAGHPYSGAVPHAGRDLDLDPTGRTFGGGH